MLIAPRPPARSTLFPYTTLFRSRDRGDGVRGRARRRPHRGPAERTRSGRWSAAGAGVAGGGFVLTPCPPLRAAERSEEHTSELQSRGHLVCRLLLEKKKNGLKNH